VRDKDIRLPAGTGSSIGAEPNLAELTVKAFTRFQRREDAILRD